MRVKVDEDLPRAVAELLREYGHDAITVLEQGMGGVKDRHLWPVVQAEGRYLVTADKGFADLRVHPPATHHGVLLLRPDRDGIGPLVRLMRAVLSVGGLEALACCVAVATPRGLRVRRPVTPGVSETTPLAPEDTPR